MQSKATSVQHYVDELPDDRKDAFLLIREAILNNLPEGFEETMSYGMVGYVVPHSIYPEGYHCDPKLPLPFLNIANQKNSINLYHMGIYADTELHDWFVSEYPNHTEAKLDMGKSCIRFKKMDQIPYELIAKLATKRSVQDWIGLYESEFKKSKK
ncbi:DUF1801 domain-containing protein [Candidatus Dojkabacteria bacterium]|uniref:DUF1801 domain-containing protein n=1 Tax=Candidatus Dojkabacteria bacterium TaxID=2099670 RepID=A0A955RKV3_9BACT|nr:DUF1801 domain-containing protein [Candidatus Dojkabacteria bacterium]